LCLIKKIITGISVAFSFFFVSFSKGMSTEEVVAIYSDQGVLGWAKFGLVGMMVLILLGLLWLFIYTILGEVLGTNALNHQIQNRVISRLITAGYDVNFNEIENSRILCAKDGQKYICQFDPKTGRIQLDVEGKNKSFSILNAIH
jgi:hypothetical protein